MTSGIRMQGRRALITASASGIHMKLAGTAALASLAAMAAQAQDIPVASIQALTGPAAFAGVHYQNAIRLAVEELNQKGGVGDKTEAHCA